MPSSSDTFQIGNISPDEHGHASSAVERLTEENARLRAEIELARHDLRNVRDENIALRADIRKLMDRRMA